MGTRPRTPSDRDLTPEQRRRELIDLLGSAAARMPQSRAIPCCDQNVYRSRRDGSDLQTAVSKSHDFADSGPSPRFGCNALDEKLSQSGRSPLDVSAEMPLSVSNPAAVNPRRKDAS